MERVARALLGAPDGQDPAKGMVRFGDIHVNLTTGRFFDMEEEAGGTHLDLIRKYKALANGQAEEWLQENITSAKPLPLPPELDAERALIGMLGMKPELVAAIEEEIAGEHFASIEHRLMFEKIAATVLTDKPVTMMTLLDACGGDKLAPVFDGYTLGGYVAKLLAEAPSSPDAAHFARALATQIRSHANREAAIVDEGDVDPAPAPWIPRFKGVRFEDIDSPGPEHSYVVDDWISEGGKFIIGGASLSGKSFLAIHMAMCIATGSPFFTNKILKPGLVIYQAGEGETGIRKRFRAWRQHFGIKQGQQVPLYIIEQKIDIFNPNADTEPFIQEIAGIARTYDMPLRAIFIDTLAKASIGADENSGRDMGVVMSNIDRISDTFPRASTGLVHHLNAGGTKLRGHTSVYANVDQVVLVVADEERKVKTATLDKQKDGESGLQIPFELMQIELGRRQVDGKPITSCVTLPLGGKLELKVKGKYGDRTINLTTQQKNILTALKNALAEYGEPTPARLKLPRSIATVVEYKHWREAYAAIAADSEEAAIKKAMTRTGERLYELGIIGKINPYVWLTGRATVETPAPPPRGNVKAAETVPVQEEFPEP